MNEKNIEELFDNREIINEEEQKQLKKEIRRGLAKNIYSRLIITLICVSVLIFAVFFIYQKYRESRSFHLDELELIIDGENMTEEDKLSKNAQWYLNSYIELTAPGYYVQYSFPNATRTADEVYLFGGAYAADRFHTNGEGFTASDHVSLQMDRYSGGIGIAPDLRGYIALSDPFQKWWADPDAYEQLYSIPASEDELTDLPSSASVKIDIKFDHPLTTEEMLALGKNYPDSQIVYAVTHVFNIFENSDAFHALGFSLIFSDNSCSLNEEAEIKYPCLKIEEQYSAEELNDHYRSVLSLLLNNKVLWADQMIAVEKVYDDILENGISILGVRMICSKHDALLLLDDENIRNAHICDIKMSRFE